MSTPVLDLILRGAVPSWVPRADGREADVVLDFVNDRAWLSRQQKPSASGLLTVSRASVGLAERADGSIASFASGAARITDIGVYEEEARTNVVLWNRDLTKAAWTKSNVTAALDQVGTDGVASVASSITANSANGTCLQAITLASSARFHTAYVKRLVGTGTVEMTMDGGTTWTAIVPTASWARYSIPTQTLANPNVGFRLGISGDSIAVDLVQNENGAFRTSPIATTTAAVARATEQISFSGYTFPSAFSVLAEIGQMPDVTVTRYIVADGSSNRLLYTPSSNTTVACFNGTGATSSGVFGLGTFTTNLINKLAFAGGSTGRLVVGNRSNTLGVDALVHSAPAQLSLGHNGGGSCINAAFRRLVIFGFRVSAAGLSDLVF